MTPQEIAKSIADELRQHPERWTQGYSARGQDGSPVAHDDTSAVCWCLLGHIWRKDPDGSSGLLDAGFSLVARKHIEFSSIVKFNDAQGRAVADVIELCDKVAQS